MSWLNVFAEFLKNNWPRQVEKDSDDIIVFDFKKRKPKTKPKNFTCREMTVLKVQDWEVIMDH